jgi:hypothetical protein
VPSDQHFAEQALIGVGDALEGAEACSMWEQTWMQGLLRQGDVGWIGQAWHDVHMTATQNLR